MASLVCLVNYVFALGPDVVVIGGAVDQWPTPSAGGKLSPLHPFSFVQPPLSGYFGVLNMFSSKL